MDQHINWGCGPFKAPAPFINVDVNAGVFAPDEDRVLVIDDVTRLPLDDGSVTRLYMGHMLEHVRWPDGVRDVLREAVRVLSPGGTAAIVGPDVRRHIENAAAGRGSLERVWESWEDDRAAGINLDNSTPHNRHWWNCEHDRVIRALERWAPELDVEPFAVDPDGSLVDRRLVDMPAWPRLAAEQWPVVSKAPGQFAVLATRRP